MDLPVVLEQSNILAKMHLKLDKYTTNIWFSPHSEIIRLVEVSNLCTYSGDIYAWRYNAAPEIGITLISELILLNPQEWEEIQAGKLSLPEGWDKSTLTSLYSGEDPRKTGLKDGLRQLNIKQLRRVIDYKGEMVLDEYNYQDGKFCPLGIGLGLDKIIENPTHDAVFSILTDMGFDVYNTRGIVGNFYTDNRKEDLLEATQEVLEEKLEQYADCHQ
jgi:hypothetical protein